MNMNSEKANKIVKVLFDIRDLRIHTEEFQSENNFSLKQKIEEITIEINRAFRCRDEQEFSQSIQKISQRIELILKYLPSNSKDSQCLRLIRTELLQLQ